MLVACLLIIVTLVVRPLRFYVQHCYSFQRLRPVAGIAGGVLRSNISFFLGLDSVLALLSRSLLRFGSVDVELLVSDELRTDDKSSFTIGFRGRVSELVRSLRRSFCWT